MKIGIVTTWYERGAAYVSRIYMDLLRNEGHEVVIYSRGGGAPDKSGEKWNEPYVTRDNKYQNLRIDKRKFFSWIRKNSLDAVLFNEQQDFRILVDTKSKFPELKIGAYVDYYTERTRKWFNIYDFVICNTYRHMQAMEAHKQKFYLRWGTDTEVYKPTEKKNEQLTFFHSVGMSVRKGTDILIDAFIDGELYKTSKLIIHTQIPISKVCKYDEKFLNEHNVDIIEKTVTAPGLYYLGDVYVYPTRLDGLGLTMYEAAASGLPIITTDFPPMNEAVKESFGKLVKVKDFYCRQDAYYYPMAICDKQSLIECMRWYVDNPEKVDEQKKAAREYAIENYNISERSKELSEIFEKAEVYECDKNLAREIKRYYKKEINSFYQNLENRTFTYKLKNKIYKLLHK